MGLVSFWNAHYAKRVLAYSYPIAPIVDAMPFLRVPLLVLAGALAALSVSSSADAQIYEYRAPDGTLSYSTTPRAGGSLQRVIGGGRTPASATPTRERASRPNPNPNAASSAFDSIIRDAAAAYGVPFALIKAVIRAESAFNPHVVSHAGAIGLMQLMPATAESLNCADPFSPRDNIFAGTQYLRILGDRYNGDMNLVLGAYNAGSGAVARAGGIPFENTRRYIERVFSFYLEYLGN